MILAAGLGTRLKPFTDKHPKALAPVNGQSVLQRNILYLQKHGIWDVIVNVHHFAGQVEEAIFTNQGWGSRVTISDEREEVLETGGGILKASPFFEGNGPFVVMNADVLTNMDLSAMIKAHRAAQPMGTLAVTTRSSSRSLLFSQDGGLCGWRNEKIGETKGRPGHAMAFSGIQVLSPALLNLIPFKGRFSMIDVYLNLCSGHKFMAYDHSQSLFMDIGSPEKLAAAEKVFP